MARLARLHVRRVAAALLAAAAAAPGALARRAPGDTRPNIVLFHPDTLRAEAFGTYGHPLSRTPNFDALAAQGVLFEQAHVQHTQCGPSRCAMVTGRYMHVLGHRTQTHLVRPYEDNFFKSLKASGYTTMLLGKNDMLAAASFNDSLSFWEGVIGVGSGPSNYSFGQAGYYSFAGGKAAGCAGSEWSCNGDLKAVGETAQWLLQDPPEPFLVYLPGIGAHPPYGAPEDYFARYSSAQVRAAAPLRQLVPGGDKPPHLGPGGIAGYRNLTGFHGGAADDELFYEIQAAYVHQAGGGGGLTLTLLLTDSSPNPGANRDRRALTLAPAQLPRPHRVRGLRAGRAHARH